MSERVSDEVKEEATNKSFLQVCQKDCKMQNKLTLSSFHTTLQKRP